MVTNVVDKFATRRKVYLDIRSESRSSYNFYGNCRRPEVLPDAEANIRFGLAEAGADRRDLRHAGLAGSTSSLWRTARPAPKTRWCSSCGSRTT